MPIKNENAPGGSSESVPAILSRTRANHAQQFLST
jgi:hypothetical protein